MADNDAILEIAAVIADGAPVDWDAASSSLVTDDQRQLLAELQFIADIADGRAAFAGDRPVQHRPSDTWGPLRIIEKVGSGTFGEVFRAWDTRLDREVALKILRRRQPGDDPRVDIIEEGRLLARVRHPNIVAVYGAERIDDQVGVWMEYVHGKTLEEELRERGPFDLDEVIAIGIQLGGALAAAHRAGLVHRDVKAQNVIRNVDRQPVLTDFGAGCVLQEASGRPTHELACTPLCAAPEVLAGRPATPQSDIYSLGVLLYHLATGTYPVQGASLEDIQQAHASDRRVPLRVARHNLPTAFTEIIERTLEKEADRRYASAEALGEALTDLRDARGSSTGRAARLTKRWWLAATCVAAVVAVVSLRALWKPEPPAIAVLPLKNLSTEDNSADFTDGLTSEIIRNLANIDGLAVRSQTSSFAFKDKARDVHAVGRELQANFVVEGSVLRSGNRLRIDAQLVRVSDDTPVWSGRFDRELKDVFAIQDEISRSIVNELRLKLGGGQRRYNTNVETYDLYLTARARLSATGTINFSRIRDAAAAFEQVIAKDPGFAPAYAGLTEAWAKGSANYAGVTSAEAYPQMRRAAERALQLDPLLAEAHAAMGRVLVRDLKWDGAERAFQRAISLNPNLPDTHTGYAISVLLPEGRVDEALRQLDAARRSDPQSDEVNSWRAFVLLSAGRYEGD